MESQIVFYMINNNFTGVTRYFEFIFKKLKERNIIFDIIFINHDSSEINNIDYLTIISEYAENIYFNKLDNKYEYGFLYYDSLYNIVKDTIIKPIFISHSSMIKETSINNKYYKSIAVSGRIQEINKCDLIIPNLIDRELFKHNYEKTENPKTAFFHNRSHPPKFLFDACEELGIELKYHKSSNQYIYDLIKDCDMIFSYGRSAYEAMSIGIPTLVIGNNTRTKTEHLYDNGFNDNKDSLLSDGWITKDSFKDLFYRNCSGWFNKITIDNKEDMINLIKDYDCNYSDDYKDLLDEYLDIEKYMNIFSNLF